MTDNVKRIGAEEAHEHLESDPEALLVCAYDDDAKFQHNHLAGAISLNDLESSADSLDRDREIIFYCA
jgi:rhodanese-related sulfurtransferase